jgi:DMSO/TMAO reductase YedYZ molybdopterin-dependent catalytic subunit
MAFMRLATAAAAVMLVAAAVADDRQGDDAHASKTLAVGGLVKAPMTLDVDALQAMPVTVIDEIVMCSPRRVKYVGKDYRGVLLRDILDAAEVDDDVRHSRNYTYVIASATDGYQVMFSLQELRNTPVGDQVLVYYEKNGEPLGTEQGLIALVSAGDYSRCHRHVRWLNRIEVHRHGATAP